MVEPVASPEASPLVTLIQLITGPWATQALYVAVALDLADLLADEPRDSATLATLTGTHGPSLHRLLRALTSLDITVEESDGRFRLGAWGLYLRRDHPQSVRAAVLTFGGPELWQAWGNLLAGVRTGIPPFDAVHGADFFSYIATHPELATPFNALMATGGAARHAAVVAAYDFAAVGTVVDVGGGNGGLLTAILRQYPAVRGILADLPVGLAGASAALAAAGVADRCTLVEADFFNTVPSGGDAYLLSSILHDWDDDRASAILHTCRRAMGPGARLLVVEVVLPAGQLSTRAAWLDLNMFALTPGKERTEAEFAALFAEAGLRLGRSIPTAAGYVVLEGSPIK